MVPSKWRQINLKVTDEQLELLKKTAEQQGCDSVQALIRSRLEDVFMVPKTDREKAEKAKT